MEDGGEQEGGRLATILGFKDRTAILDEGKKAWETCVHDYWAWPGICDAFASFRTISRALTVCL